MQILDIEIVSKPGESLKEGLAAEIADAAGEIFGSNPGGTWVKLHNLARLSYAENGGGPTDDIYPVFVSLLKAEWSATDEMAKEAKMLSTEIGRICDRPPENVHILFAPSGKGRTFFGGS